MLQKLNSKKNKGFTLVEIMIVVAIIALLAAIAVPNFLRARKRSQATRVLEDLRLIEAAIDQHALENNLKAGEDVTWADVRKYLKTGTTLETSGGKDALGSDFVVPFNVDAAPQVPAATFTELSEVAPAEFWKQFYTSGGGTPPGGGTNPPATTD